MDVEAMVFALSKSDVAWSLKTRVQWIAFLSLCTGLIIGGFSMYYAADIADDQVIDQRVELLAVSILKRLEIELSKGRGITDGFARPSAIEPGIHNYQVWTSSGTLLHKSQGASALRPILPVDFTGYREIGIAGVTYCAYSVASSDRSIVVQVAEPTPARTIEVALLASEFLAIAFIPFALNLLGIQKLLKRTCQPLDDVSDELRLRRPMDASTIQSANAPIEMLPLVAALNTHLKRMGRALSAENRFTSVAAHELRTPLAGIRAQAQLARTAQDPEEIRESLEAVMRGVDSASRLIQQLVDLHHLASDDDRTPWHSTYVNLPAIHEQVVVEFGPSARDKHIELKILFEVDKMQGNEFAIWTLLRNLVANAIQYSPTGGQVAIRIKRRDSMTILSVDDSGPGIAPSARERAFEKFNRLGRRGSDGVGLGLSIVAGVAEMHQTQVALLDSPLGGLRVVVHFHSTNDTAPVARQVNNNDVAFT